MVEGAGLLPVGGPGSGAPGPSGCCGAAVKLCRSCDAQFSDEHARCIHCGRKLFEVDRPEPRGLPQLASLHHLLQEAGITFTLITDSGTRSVDWYHGSSGWKARASVYVEPVDRDQAEAIHREFLEHIIPHLAEMDRRGTPEGPSCPACYEPISPLADTCPSCGLAFPTS